MSLRENPADSLGRLVLLALFCVGMVWAVYHPADSTAVENGDALGLCLALMIWGAGATWMLRMSPTFQWRRTSWWGDAAPIMLAGWVFLSAWITGGFFASTQPAVGGDLRSATNEAWWWIAGATVFVVARRLFQCRQASAAAIGLLISLGGLLAVHTLHQYFISFPETIREYQNDPDGMLAKIGLDAEAGTAARMIFENRMRDGGPTGTFALANSLAGPLAMCVTLCAGVVICWIPRYRNRDGSRPDWIGGAAVVGVMVLTLIALLTTGSRSGVLSVMVVAFASLGIVFYRKRAHSKSERVDAITSNDRNNHSQPVSMDRRTATRVAVLATATLGVFAVLWKYGQSLLGGEWVTQAPATIQLRSQYWRSTLGIASDHPWFGAGPGNFQLVYQKYRDVRAHELIAEPHNFFFETLACGGWIAAGLLVLFLIAGTLVYRRASRTSELSLPEPAKVSNGERVRIAIAVGIGTVLAFMAVWYMGIVTGNLPDFDAHLLAVPIAISTLAIWLYAMHETSELLTDNQCRNIAAASAATGLTHLCFSGGWTVPGVSMFLIALAAIAAKWTPPENAETPNRQANTFIPRVATVGLMGVLIMVSYFFSYRPVRRSDAALSNATMLASTNRGAAATTVLKEALRSDPLNSDIAIWLSTIDNQELLPSLARNPSTTRQRKIADASIDEAVRRSGNDPVRLRAIAELLLHRYQVAGVVDDLVAANEILDRARELSPTHEAITAQQAAVLHELEQNNKGAELTTSKELAERARMLASSGGVITRVLDLQPIMPAKVFGARAIERPVRQSAEKVLKWEDAK
ncbi:O-antigen ligase [Rhodopirellula rubra]|uniref:O-antigen ligase n=1 Tax=Aporhodopirellula rubra TaxID=980271 RepID=A0A7W5H751_9BACT|nr:O-antigen ligase family protein [Aporhodopirellula rubra]MBB3209272.1 O-antigen ligase [Aporhodopirellula rubra]